MTMRLGTRLTTYYASSTALILVGFSIALYAMVAEHLYRQVDERIESALDTLAAAAEIDLSVRGYGDSYKGAATPRPLPARTGLVWLRRFKNARSVAE